MVLSAIYWLMLGMLTWWHHQPDDAIKLVIHEKKISVKGKTSIGGFTCRYSDKNVRDTLFVDFSSRMPDLVFDIVVDDFGCGNFVLNRDFKRTLKHKEFPKARVRVGNITTNNGKYFCDLSVTIVGKKLDFRELELSRTEGGVTAAIDLGFSTLGLEPPRKMGGLVTVDEELNLEIFLGFKRQR